MGNNTSPAKLKDDYADDKLFPAPFQRENKWSPKQLQDFVIALFEGVPFGQLVLFEKQEEDQERSDKRIWLVLDGAHRTRAVLNFMKNNMGCYVESDNEWLWYDRLPQFHKDGLAIADDDTTTRNKRVVQQHMHGNNIGAYERKGPATHRLLTEAERRTFKYLSIAVCEYKQMSNEIGQKIFKRCQFSVKCSLEDQLRGLRAQPDHLLVCKLVKEEQSLVIGKLDQFLIDNSKGIKMQSHSTTNDILTMNFPEAKPNFVTCMVSLFHSFVKSVWSSDGLTYKPGDATRPESLYTWLIANDNGKDQSDVNDFFDSFHECCDMLIRLKFKDVKWKHFVVYFHALIKLSDDNVHFSDLLSKRIRKCHGHRPWEMYDWVSQGGSDLSSNYIDARIGHIRSGEWFPGAYIPKSKPKEKEKAKPPTRRRGTKRPAPTLD
jgi:hypothetical protein